jgi:hypothetical protein
MGAFAALAASSQAQITFSNLPSDITQVGYGDVQVQNNNLGDTNLQGAPGGGLQYTESFKLNEASNTVVKATVDEVLSGVSDGSLSLTAWINGTQFYNSSVTNLDGTGNTETALATTGFTNLALGPGTYVVTYTATYSGLSNTLPSYGYINSFNAFFQESGQNPPPPVPEPASFAVVGIGLIGICARRRGVK